ncbi:hypothetical protein BS50DRAFT_580971 [Corynespora cassiicola Philippines]|uniref:Uncharacterized protein n=1 Tax=Corynespora cassiicola Philippines TaxID=1448308 RepID=A0A2T2P912_CORCC|nr:hypothetical protein BS50DRAFT_580971 [Corynespora cassiicola Philippines]
MPPKRATRRTASTAAVPSTSRGCTTRAQSHQIPSLPPPPLPQPPPPPPASVSKSETLSKYAIASHHDIRSVYFSSIESSLVGALMATNFPVEFTAHAPAPETVPKQGPKRKRDDNTTASLNIAYGTAARPKKRLDLKSVGLAKKRKEAPISTEDEKRLKKKGKTAAEPQAGKYEWEEELEASNNDLALLSEALGEAKLVVQVEPERDSSLLVEAVKAEPEKDPSLPAEAIEVEPERDPFPPEEATFDTGSLAFEPFAAVEVSEESAPEVARHVTLSPLTSHEFFFEYTVHQKIWTGAEDDYEPTLDPSLPENPLAFRSLATANFLASQFQQNSAAHSAGVHWHRWVHTTSNNGCALHQGSFSGLETPEKRSWVRIWVDRNMVPSTATRPIEYQYTVAAVPPPTVRATMYVIRLWRLVEESSVADDDSRVVIDVDADPLRVQYPFPDPEIPEIYTDLGLANRMAARLQIELSHEASPQGPVHMRWQEVNRVELEVKAQALGCERCWNSRFNGKGHGAARFELVVEKKKVWGPRNV